MTRGASADLIRLVVPGPLGQRQLDSVLCPFRGDGLPWPSPRFFPLFPPACRSKMVFCGPSFPFSAILTCSPSPATTGAGSWTSSASRWKRSSTRPSRASRSSWTTKRRQGEPVAQLILVHGLEGSSAAGYARSLAQAALEAGCAAASIQHAQLRRNRASERQDPLSFRPDLRSARGDPPARGAALRFSSRVFRWAATWC